MPNMKKSLRAHRNLSPVLMTLCLGFASLLVFTQARDVTAVRVSEEEVVGKPPTKVAPPPEAVSYTHLTLPTN